ncbi:leucine-rich repeat-containing protein 47-like [Vespa crabro]|uniref:leucine-rich repeat-containing protein 47-like n=1 Tax=Vespa crabro TaxID=7445 RepID=UPI001F02EFB1|nr:leucine-rich repeat-containing protein 47-like [Vespa crabro]XP_046819533.1 leucine-rich repeat-containing protein 47-like [Vespa crabro]
MAFEKSWDIIKQTADKNKHQLVLTGQSISQLIAENGLDKTLFDLENLNYLNINNTCLQEIPEEIEKLQNLTALVLYSNKIDKLPASIEKLTKLKFLNCSQNKLTSLPDAIGNFPQLSSLNFGTNLLQSIPCQRKNLKLTTLDLSNNNLQVFPDVCYTELIHLCEIYVNMNQIKDIPEQISRLQVLRVLNIADNLLTAVPGELADCHKLKELNLKNNYLADKRLLKLVDQCHSKQVLEYIKQHCPKLNPTAVDITSKSKKGKKGHKLSENENITAQIDALAHKLKILRTSDSTLSIKFTEHVKNVRPYIIACIVKNLVFTEDTFKKFIQLQTKLHDGKCGKRNIATIATHDLNAIVPGDLTYTAKPPLELEIKPLMRNKTYTGTELFQQLQKEADNLRKEKKRSVYSSIHKYLYLLEGKALFPCLVDNQEQVISFPPITNSDLTKMSPTTKDMLIEVTSAISYQVCRNVLDQLLKELVTTGIGCAPSDNENNLYYSLQIEQVKVVDIEGNLKVVYPSRADLNFKEDNIIALRD